MSKKIHGEAFKIMVLYFVIKIVEFAEFVEFSFLSCRVPADLERFLPRMFLHFN